MSNPSISPEKVISLTTPLLNKLSEVILGKDEQLKLAVCCILAEGHLLIEDLPGMGKTTLSQALGKVFGMEYQRIQFTSDILPADILGVSVFEAAGAGEMGKFVFHPGPVFNQLILADEINRATPKAQSALLEAMEERQVTVEGETRPLPKPFFVIATQNPVNQSGTFALPESQLDRFLMCLEMGYPSEQAEREILEGVDRRQMIDSMSALLTLDQLSDVQDAVLDVHISSTLMDYIQRVIAYTRQKAEVEYGLSPRGAQALVRATKAWALLHGRAHAVPEDVQAVLASVIDHRMPTGKNTDHKISQHILNEVNVL